MIYTYIVNERTFNLIKKEGFEIATPTKNIFTVTKIGQCCVGLLNVNHRLKL